MKLNGVDEPVLENQGNIAFHLKKGINNIELFYQDSQLISYLGTADNQLLSRTSNSLNFTSEVKSEKVFIYTKIANYPGWQLSVDNITQLIKTLDGRIIIELAKGKHNVMLKFSDTKSRQFSNYLSLLTLISILSYSAYVWKKTKS